MQIDEAVLTRLESLSAIKIAEDGRAKMLAELDEILKMVERLGEQDLPALGGGDEPTGTPLREDGPEGGAGAQNEAAKRSRQALIESVLATAPAREGAFFVVPKIIE